MNIIKKVVTNHSDHKIPEGFIEILELSTHGLIDCLNENINKLMNLYKHQPVDHGFILQNYITNICSNFVVNVLDSYFNLYNKFEMEILPSKKEEILSLILKQIEITFKRDIL